MPKRKHSGKDEGESKSKKRKANKKNTKHPLEILNGPFVDDSWWTDSKLWELKPILLDHVQGSIRGGINGDSLGVPHEFPKWMKCKYTGKQDCYCTFV